MRDKKNTASKTLNPLDEYYLLPLMLCLALASSICLIYFLFELTKSPFEIQNYYGWDTSTYVAYQKQLIPFIIAAAALLCLQFFSLRWKRRWLYLLLIGLNVVLFVYLPRLLDFSAST